jgi:hypothetical protein
MRGRTRPGRLRAFDRWLALAEPELFASPGVLIDVGFGVSAITTHELSTAFPRHRVIGLDADGLRVLQAKREFPKLDLRHGGLLVVLGERNVRLVRVANVGRALSKSAVAAVVQLSTALVSKGGVVLEGSTDVAGHVSAFLVWRHGGSQPETLVLHTDGSRGFSPWLFRDVLPRELRRDVREGTPIHDLLTDWERAWSIERPADPLAAYQASARALARARTDVDDRFIDEGFVAWRPDDGKARGRDG